MKFINAFYNSASGFTASPLSSVHSNTSLGARARAGVARLSRLSARAGATHDTESARAHDCTIAIFSNAKYRERPPDHACVRFCEYNTSKLNESRVQSETNRQHTTRERFGLSRARQRKKTIRDRR